MQLQFLVAVAVAGAGAGTLISVVETIMAKEKILIIVCDGDDDSSWEVAIEWEKESLELFSM